MAETSWNPKNPRIQSNGKVPRIIYSTLEDASMTFHAGSVVRLEASTGQIESLGTGAYTQSPILGIAMKDASGTENTEIPVMVFEPGQEVIFRITNNGTETLNSSATLGKAYGLYVDSTNYICYADLNVANQDMVVYNGPVLDVTGAATYDGKFVILPTMIQSGIGI